MNSTAEECRALQEYIVEIRRRLHQIPETGIHNPLTQSLICAELDKMGIPYWTNTVELAGLRDTGIVALIQGQHQDKVIALRADADALPITEETGLSYPSRHPGRMHACGHDNHCAMLLAAAKVLMEHKAELKGSVKLFFQSGEEIITGARLLIQGGCMENPRVTACFGLHVWPLPGQKPGAVAVIPGCMMASGNKFSISIQGAGTHGSLPQLGRDPIVCAAQLITALQNISSRELAGDEPRVLSICQVHAGSSWNIIPTQAYLEGTIRTTSAETQRFYKKRIEEITAGLCTALRCQGQVQWLAEVPPVLNDPAFTSLVAEAVKEALGPEFLCQDFKASMGNEDFAHYQALAPGAFAFLNIAGSDPATHLPVHNPAFQVEESILWQGTALHVQTALDYLK